MMMVTSPNFSDIETDDVDSGVGDDVDYGVDVDSQVSASSPNFSMVETDVTTIKLTGLAPNTQVDNQESKHMDSGTADH